MQHIDKARRSAVVHWSDDHFTEVSFFLQNYAEGHSGRELILDVLNSKSDFLPLEEAQKKKISMVNKQTIRWVELKERDLLEEVMFSQEQPVEVEMLGGKVFQGMFPVEMPPERSRLSDHLNFTPQFLYLLREDGDLILNKSYVISVREEKRP
jgi:hypothetical protein